MNKTKGKKMCVKCRHFYNKNELRVTNHGRLCKRCFKESRFIK